MNIVIQKASENMRSGLGQLTAKAFRNEFDYPGISEETLASVLSGIFITDRVYAATAGGQTAGMLAVSDNNLRAVKFNNAEAKELLSPALSAIVDKDLSEELNARLDLPDGACFIEYIATGENMRGKGVASALINYVLKNLDYDTFLLEVNENNIPAVGLYKKCGFKITGLSPLLPEAGKIVMIYKK